MFKNVNKFKCFLMLRVVCIYILQAGAAEHFAAEGKEAESFRTSLLLSPL